MFKTLIERVAGAKNSLVHVAKYIFDDEYQVKEKIEEVRKKIENSPFNGILELEYSPEEAWFPSSVELVYITGRYRYKNRVKAHPELFDEIFFMVEDIKKTLNRNNPYNHYIHPSKAWRGS